MNETISIKEQMLSKVLIVGLAPYFLDRGFLWYEENLVRVLRARKTQSFWQDNTVFVKTDEKINLSEFLRKLDELGYEKVFKIQEPGEFSQRGGVVDVFPVNLKFAVRLDFLGNKIETIERVPLEVKNEQKAKHVLKNKLKSQKQFSDLKNLKPGDYLVHLDHGVARFQGIKNFQFSIPACIGYAEGIAGRSNFQSISNSLIFKQKKQDKEYRKYYVLEYASCDKLYVPLGLERKLSRYVGFREPKLSRLGSSLWQRTKQKIKEEAEKFARELLKTFAQKETAARTPYQQKEITESLSSTFKYSLTPDQKQALQDIFQDMEKTTPINRLVCGDVGFGKTEVALRTAVRAAENNKQTAILAPTTILAQQHFITFQKRLKNLAVKLAMLSRLEKKQKREKIMQGLKQGRIDIVIGTHSLLSKNVIFKNLGLLIIDDEQKFGVRQKEKLRKLKPEIDVLSLSATPIPRTLYMAMSSLKDISLIQTPPEGRKAVKTFVSPFNKATVKKAIEKEIARDGQIYFLHNRVETIQAFKKFLQKTIKTNYSISDDRHYLKQNKKLLKQVKIGILHAKLPEKEIVKIMQDFQKGKFNLLLATTIIENGLDIPNVNTLIVDNATKLGLSQAYQIRGRIGRSNRQSFAYFLYPKRQLKGLAQQRLKALKEAQELGSGYRVAMRDLEIRGAGNILGKEQSGAVNKIGLNLYCQMLSEAIEKLKTSPNMIK